MLPTISIVNIGLSSIAYQRILLFEGFGALHVFLDCFAVMLEASWQICKVQNWNISVITCSSHECMGCYASNIFPTKKCFISLFKGDPNSF